MVSIDEQRALQRENAEADARLWTGLQEINADQAEGQQGRCRSASKKAADPEAAAAKGRQESRRSQRTASTY
jgi:hypothetical protein